MPRLPLGWLCVLMAFGAGVALTASAAPAAVDGATTSPKPPALSPLRRGDLLADVDVLQQAYETLHPGLYRYNTPTQMQARFAALRRDLGRDQSLADAFLALSRFTAAIRCGHTYPNFYNQSRAVQQALFEGDDRLPFHFAWLGERMVVTRDLTGSGLLPRGTEVLAIDGVPARDILRRLLPLVRADGGNDGKRRALLEVQGDDKYETFDVYFPLVFPRRGADYRLQVRRPGAARAASVAVAPQSFAARLAARPGADDGKAPWSLTVTEDGLAVLSMPTWALYNSDWDWKAYLADAFQRLAAAPSRALVIDLRGNEGGEDVGEAILPHLIDAPIEVVDAPPLVRYRRVPDALAPYLDTWDPSFKDWGAQAVPVDDRYFRLERFEQTQGRSRRIAPQAPRLHAPLFVLVGPTNSSATFQFAQEVQRAHLGTLVGEETGGNQRGINGGAFFFLRLPHTGLEVDLPLIARFYGKDRPDGGLQPDVPAPRSVGGIIEGRDEGLEAVRRSLGRNVTN